MFQFPIRYLLWPMVVMAMGCNRQPQESVLNPQFDSEVQEVDRRAKVANQLIAEQEASVQRAKNLLSKQEQQLERMDRLLDKMTEQAKRKDAILEAEEKQLGIKTDSSRQ